MFRLRSESRIWIALAILAAVSAAIAGWYFLVHAESGPAGEFEIGNREHSAVRLTMLLEEVPAIADWGGDPIQLAKGVVALERMLLLCNNFEIHEDLDPACDHILKAADDLESRLDSEVEAAAEDLRSVMSRREMAAFELEEPWDRDISEYELGGEIRLAIDGLLTAMKACSARYQVCDEPTITVPVAAFIRLRGPMIAARPEDAQGRITYHLTSQLVDLVQAFSETDDLWKDSAAERVVLEIIRLGIR
ncbi:MAG: hypothetical protein OXH19_13300 [Chloroflexi bacterium]|nr:hypothetical protein [Chloroflexota bacterium]MCY3589409.1 hypothetical protein [Chloroflexota bacterium]MCY3684589.1 hypothetical protein [Chloroflexota bacterium]MDE2710126.1 hypothetical protein [Chloroflexota bacterium]